MLAVRYSVIHAVFSLLLFVCLNIHSMYLYLYAACRVRVCVRACLYMFRSVWNIHVSGEYECEMVNWKRVCACVSEKWSQPLNFNVCIYVCVCAWVHSNDDDEAQNITNICHSNNKIEDLAAIVSQCNFDCHIETCRKYMENAHTLTCMQREIEKESERHF